MNNKATIYVGDVLTGIKNIQDGSVQCCITSPPYWGLRDYGHDDQIGLESTPEQYVNNMVAVFREVWRILADDGVLWLNLGDSYAGNSSRASNNGRAGFGTEREGVFAKSGNGLKPKDLVGIPWRVAFALQQDGWYLRQDIIWHKPNPMPESVTDRCTKAHEYVFLLSKSQRYFFDNKAIAEEATTTGTGHRFGGNKYDSENKFYRTKGGTYTNTGERNKRDVWTIPTKPFKGAHFAVMPEALVIPCLLAGSKIGDLIFDPFTGSGTVGAVAMQHQRNFVGTELNPEFAAIAEQRIQEANMLFSEVELVHHD